MRLSCLGSAPWRFIIVQLAIVASLLLFFRFYLPRHQRTLAAQATATREQKIISLEREMIVEDTSREVSVPLDGTMVKRHPKHLRNTATPDAIEAQLGVPSSSMVDFRGGQHLTWIGTAHKVEAAFDSGSLFCLTTVDLTTHVGEYVYQSDEMYHPF